MKATILDSVKNNRYLQFYLDNCVRCGACIEACHFYQGDPDNPLHAPVYKNELVRRLVKQETLLGKLGFYGKVKDGDKYSEDLAYAVYQSCTNCRRCVTYCPFSIDISVVNTAVRAALIKNDLAPEIQLMLADMQIERRENTELYLEAFKNQITEIENDVREELNDPTFKIPLSVDTQEASVLYVPLSGEHTITPAAKIFHAAGEDWTMSLFDSSNMGFLTGDVARAKQIAGAVVEEAKKVGAKKLVVSECGHAYRIMKQFIQVWFEEKAVTFDVELIDETIASYIKEGKIKLDKSKNPGRFTHHDPCQHARNAGMTEEPRYVLNHAVSEFVEMIPNRKDNWCCGGGGGVVAVPDFDETRMKGGKMKAEQIKAAKAIVKAKQQRGKTGFLD
ncbi:MAG: (Fe-S)-binding protein, partial [Candidatus Odinarchaeota archaeon]